ncbi:MAG: hypothetical protein, partial [Olavius algarvensis Gamma 1 endosymbiont]
EIYKYQRVINGNKSIEEQRCAGDQARAHTAEVRSTLSRTPADRAGGVASVDVRAKPRRRAKRFPGANVAV